MIDYLFYVQTLQGVLIQTPSYQIYHCRIQRLMVSNHIIDLNILEDDIGQIRFFLDIERIRPDQKLVEHNPYGPDIDLLVVLFTCDKLWTKV